MFLKTTKPTSEDKKTEGAQKPDLLKNQPKINCTESPKDFSNTFDQDTTTTNCSEQRKLSLPSKQLSGSEGRESRSRLGLETKGTETLGLVSVSY